MTAPSTRPAPSPLPNGRNGQAKPQLPSFLMSPSLGASLCAVSTLTDAVLDIDNKYQDLTWAERERCAEAVRHKNTPEFRWGHFNNPMYMDKFGNCMDRYGNVKPWNHNRVRLKVPEKKLDYVNASTITVNPLKEGSLPPLRFIAMQGPTEGSFQFVWRMITEQTTSPAVIVQLTTMSEGGNEKCDQYFPLDGPGPHATWRLNEDDVWGDGWYAQLTNEHVEKLEDGAIEKRKLVLRMLKKKRKQAKKEDSDDDSDKGMDLKVDSSDDDMSDDDEEDASDDDDTSDNIEYLEGHEPLVIWHFLYRRWPDFRVPQGEDLPSFFKLMTLSREYCSNDSPRIIHCSAGVGRTGTFISLEHMMRELEAGSLESWDAPPGRTHSFRGRVGAKERAPGRDLVYDTVDCLRQQRKLMVQSPSQYRFLYQVMRRLWVEKYGGSVSDDDEEKITTRPLGFLDKPAVEEDPVSDMDADGADGPDIGGGVAIGDIL